MIEHKEICFKNNEHCSDEYTIGEVSAMMDLPTSTLRYYEELGLLPKVKRTATNQRIYTKAHIDRLSAICCFKRTGMNMARLQQFFQYEENQEEHMEEIITLLENQEQEVVERIQQYEEDLEHVKHKIRFYNEIKEALKNHKPAPLWEDVK